MHETAVWRGYQTGFLSREEKRTLKIKLYIPLNLSKSLFLYHLLNK